MALTSPFSLATFLDGLCIAQAKFDLTESVAANRQGSGEVLTHKTGVSLWAGSISLRSHRIADAEAIKAKVSVLRRPGFAFFIEPYGKEFPRLDPTGSILGVSTPTIQSVAGNNRDLTIQGLPVGYVLSPGDYLSFPYTVASIGRTALHQIVVGGTANGSGVATVEVTPLLRTGAVAGLAVTLKHPICKAVVEPGSFEPGTMSNRRWTQEMSFGFRQTLR